MPGEEAANSEYLALINQNYQSPSEVMRQLDTDLDDISQDWLRIGGADIGPVSVSSFINTFEPFEDRVTYGFSSTFTVPVGLQKQFYSPDTQVAVFQKLTANLSLQYPEAELTDNTSKTDEELFDYRERISIKFPLKNGPYTAVLYLVPQNEDLELLRPSLVLEIRHNRESDPDSGNDYSLTKEELLTVYSGHPQLALNIAQELTKLDPQPEQIRFGSSGSAPVESRATGDEVSPELTGRAEVNLNTDDRFPRGVEQAVREFEKEVQIEEIMNEAMEIAHFFLPVGFWMPIRRLWIIIYYGYVI